MQFIIASEVAVSSCVVKTQRARNAMNKILTLACEKFVPSSLGRDQGHDSSNCQHVLPLSQHSGRRRPKRLISGNLNADGKCPLGSDGTGAGNGEEELCEINWAMFPAPPITPPAAFRPNPDSCYQRIHSTQRGKALRPWNYTL